jgi:hypothetical protein
VAASRTTARIIGILFIVASATAIIGGALLAPLDKADYLTQVASHDGQMAAGALFEIVLEISVIGIAVMFFPILKRRNEGLALGYVGVRIVEAALLLAASVSALVVLTLSQDYGQTAGAEPVGDVLLATRDWTYLLGSLLALGIGALVLYPLLYQARLVPSWISLWGLAGAILIVVRGVIEVFGVDLSVGVQGVLTAPIAINEMVLAVWLIVRGFSQPARSLDTAPAS